MKYLVQVNGEIQYKELNYCFAHAEFDSMWWCAYFYTIKENDGVVEKHINILLEMNE